MKIKMNYFVKYFLFLQFSVQLLSVLSYTVVLKQVKTLHPSVKVYRYELRPSKLLPESNTQYVYHKPLLGQRIYPVPLKHGRDGNFKPRPPLKKEKGKYYKGGEKPLSTPLFRDPRLLGISPSQHLVPPVSNQLEDHPEAKEEEDEVRPLVTTPNLGKGFTSFGQEKGKVYNNPGEWATPAPQADTENSTKAEFTPSQLYLQIRHKNTVIHVPQSEALKDAETLEELINAPRLKELARTTHVQETYSEEGYEDAGYDHAGHIRQAQHGEVYNAKDEGKFRIKDPPVIIDYDSDLEESKKVSLKNVIENQTEENDSNKLEPRITRSRTEVSKTSMEFSKAPKNYKGGHKYSSRVKGPEKNTSENEKYNISNTNEYQEPTVKFPSYFGEVPPTPETFISNDSSVYFNPTSKKSSKYRKDDFNSTKIYPVPESSPTQVNEYTDFKPYISLIDTQASPSAKSLKYSRIYSKKTKQLRLEPYKNENIYSPPPPPPPTISSGPLHEDLQPPSIDNKPTEEESINQRIVLPTIGYINSLTTAYFGKDNPKSTPEESKTQLTNPLNLTQALDYLRSQKNQKNLESTKPPTEIDIRTFEPMKIKKSRPSIHNYKNKSKRDIYIIKTRDRRSEKETEEYEGNDESDEPHVEKNEEIAEDERKRIEEENAEKEKYEASLRQEISNQEKEIIQEAYKNIGVEDDISEVFPEFPSSDSESDFSSHPEETTPTPVDVKKYPFYQSKRLPENSALRYATDPKKFPKKSGYKMEFYDSREEVIQCPDFHPDLEDLPNSNSTEYSEQQAGENQRLSNLGDKIACLRMKYFDPEPFDNPIFKEKEIDYVGKPRNQKKISNYPLKSQSGHTIKVSPNTQTKTHILPQETKQSPSHFLRPETNKTGTPRVIPVTETLNDVSTSTPATFSNPLIGWRTVYHSKPSLPHHLRYTKSASQSYPQYHKSLPKHIILPYNCLHNISKLVVLEGTKNVIIDCRDAKVIQEVVKNVARLRIIPKEEKKTIKKKWSDKISYDESDWVPIVGPTLPKHIGKFHRSVNRRTDEVTKIKNETNDNIGSNHYVIDGLKEEENVRKGEVVDDINHYMKLMDDLKEEEKSEVNPETTEPTTEATEKRKRRETENYPPNVKFREGGDAEKTEQNKPIDVSKLYEKKKPLTRLSGIDFLIKYHKNKGKPTTEKTEDFWKVSNTQKPQKKNSGTEKPIRITLKSTEENRGNLLQSTTAANIKRTKTTDSQQPNKPMEKNTKFKLKQTEIRKISPLSIIPEKITKRPEIRTSDFRKTTTAPFEIPLVVTKISVEKSHSTTSSRTIQNYPKTTKNPEIVEFSTPSAKKPETPQYKTINRNSNSLSNDSKQQNKSTENLKEPVLYYIVNLKTGRGKWITRYEESRKGNPAKTFENQNFKENIEQKRDKRKKNRY